VAWRKKGLRDMDAAGHDKLQYIEKMGYRFRTVSERYPPTLLTDVLLVYFRRYQETSWWTSHDVTTMILHSSFANRLIPRSTGWSTGSNVGILTVHVCGGGGGGRGTMRPHALRTWHHWIIFIFRICTIR
jgi:hypothetical protein